MSWRNESGGRWSDGDLEPIDGLRSDSNEWERSSTSWSWLGSEGEVEVEVEVEGEEEEEEEEEEEGEGEGEAEGDEEEEEEEQATEYPHLRPQARQAPASPMQPPPSNGTHTISPRHQATTDSEPEEAEDYEGSEASPNESHNHIDTKMRIQPSGILA